QQQAARNGDMLKSLIGEGAGFDFVASPLRRTRDTMERIRTRMGIDPWAYRTDARLMEVNFGAWQGYMLEDIEARSPD
ncbi:histidine phosphatase family protein, partial [Mycobacterium tuberculosis]|nr:histidine phosphatase family protein [Mycobacterium tuberculosis]